MTHSFEQPQPNNSNQIVQGLWVGGTLPMLPQLCIRSFLANGHDFHLYTYQPVDRVPAGTRIIDAREILSESRIFRKQEGFGSGSFAPFSDCFRYQLLWEKGGWWVDMDLVCLKPFDFAASHVLATRWERKEANAVVGCAMKFPAGDAMIRFCLDACERSDLGELRYGQVGPDLLAQAVRELDAEWMTTPWTTFCPIGYRDAGSVILPPYQLSLRRIRNHIRRRPDIRVGNASYAVHLWNEMWRHKKLDTEATYHQRSFLEQLKARYAEEQSYVRTIVAPDIALPQGTLPS